MLDITVLRICLVRSDWQKISAFVPKGGFDESTTTMLKAISKYYHTFTDHTHVDRELFAPWFIRNCTHGLSREQAQLYLAQITQMFMVGVDDSARNGIIGELVDLKAVTNMANIIDEFQNGDLSEAVLEVMQRTLDEAKAVAGITTMDWVDKDIGEILQADMDDSGLRFRLQCINRSMRGLRPGDFGIVAGRPDTGKTSFLASEATHWASQLPEDKPVLWLNNEGPGERIVPRLYQAALGYTVPELAQAWEEKRIMKEYEEAIRGPKSKIKVVDIHGWSYGHVGAMIERERPGLVIYDMIDHIAGFADAGRTDERLEEMYKWARVQCVKYETIGIATSQISAEGDGVILPSLSMLKDSKTGKQGQADFQLMIGASNDPTMKNARWVSLAKNKLHRMGGPKSPDCEVVFQPHIARYTDIPTGQ